MTRDGSCTACASFSMYSRVRCARRSKGMAERREFLGSTIPTPTPSAKRPLQTLSRLAITLASTIGLCSGTRQMPVARRILLVTAATKLSVTNGSSQSASAESGNLPLSEYGYFESC